jgi:hypothetical protein
MRASRVRPDRNGEGKSKLPGQAILAEDTPDAHGAPPGRQSRGHALCAICHLSHALIWEYNIPQRLAVARHAASGAWLKFQRRPYRIRPA